MHGVGPSTVLGGRYAVQRRLEKLPDAERWSAHDTTLERDVVLVCFPETAAHADATLDAARRAAGIDNSRLVRVLDVGRSEGIAFFVEEPLHDAELLTGLLEQGGLPAEEVRRIAGEVATGLESARGRGLHHLRLTPNSVVRTGDGAVKVRGLATDAAMAGIDDIDPETAARTDAVGVVAVTYAALTSRWPLDTHVPGLESAPHLVNGVPAPSELAAGVPGDLDALCRLTLNDDQGPVSPGDFAAQIAPWSMTQVQGFATSAAPSDDPTPTVALPVDELRARAAGAGGARAAASGAASPGSSAGTSDDTTRTMPIDLGSRAGGAGSAPARVPAAAAGAGLAAGAAAGGAGAGGATASGEASSGAAGAAGTAGAAGAAVSNALETAGQVAAEAAHKVGSFARAAADKAAARLAERQAAQRQAEESDDDGIESALVETGEPLDPPLPLLPQELGAPPTRDQSRLVLLIVAVFVVVATIAGFIGVSRIGSSTDLGFGSPPAANRNTVTVTAPPTTVSPSTGTDEDEEQDTGDFAILSAIGYDPEGDKAERNGEAARVYDGKTSTYWSSEGYASENLGGLKKGVGVRLDLGQVRSVSQVTLVMPDPSDVTVYVGEGRERADATELGSSKGKSGTVTIKASGDKVKGQYVFVWFTKVSQVSDGRHRATLAEVTVR